MPAWDSAITGCLLEMYIVDIILVRKVSANTYKHRDAARVAHIFQQRADCLFAGAVLSFLPQRRLLLRLA